VCGPVQHALLSFHSPLEETPHKAGVEGETEIVSATRAAVAVFAERGGTAALDGPHHLVLRPGEAGMAALDKTPAPGTQDVGHFQNRPAHDRSGS